MDLSTFEGWARLIRLIRDLGLIIGVPTLIVVAVYFYNQQIGILKARAELLKETQFDRALSLIRSQKELYEIDRRVLEERIVELLKHGPQSEEEIRKFEAQIILLDERIREALARQIYIARGHLGSPQIEKRVEKIQTPIGQSKVIKSITYTVTFSSTPDVILEVREPLKHWKEEVSTTGFIIVLEKEGGFAGEEIQLKWVAVEDPVDIGEFLSGLGG